MIETSGRCPAACADGARLVLGAVGRAQLQADASCRTRLLPTQNARNSIAARTVQPFGPGESVWQQWRWHGWGVGGGNAPANTTPQRTQVKMQLARQTESSSREASKSEVKVNSSRGAPRRVSDPPHHATTSTVERLATYITTASSSFGSQAAHRACQRAGAVATRCSIERFAVAAIN